MTDRPTAPAPSRNRRGLLVFGAAAVAFLAAPRIWQRFALAPQGEPHPNVQGYLRLPDGAVTGADPFAGLTPPNPDAIVPTPMPPTGPALCAALFRDGIKQGTVPVAFFTDVNCPFCRAMEQWLPHLPTDQVSLTWHDLPLLGPASEMAARAVAAAALQDAGDAMRARLNRAQIQPTVSYIAQVATGIGLDGDRLATDMTSPAVTARVAQSMGLANGFLVPGTPALIVGRTLAVGQRPEGEVKRLIGDAAARGNGVCT
ncbi:DsbA family protein [Meridianimarinicoccus aquatilis]|uniref:DSBA-like thioredoxin domain-containing protein n=1 Tax=Meridianimarinicoccus aquatilis TaxID=2552766 RepID=A0A4R6B5G6_9RHOB|nr:DsbA family protein [Fluviibacterium aquatile]TDL90753.1 hypothetical protein E2L05_04380 [Fluviibacterium aquatile]